MPKRIIYTGPQDSVMIRMSRPRFIKPFHRWKEPVLVPDDVCRYLLKIPGFIEEGFSMSSWLSQDLHKNFYIEAMRMSAMGDVLMLILALEDCPELKGRVCIKTQSRYEEIVDSFGWGIKSIRPGMNLGLRVHLDGIVERDAHKEEYFETHRVDMFREILGGTLKVRPSLVGKDNSFFWEKVFSPTPRKPYYLINFKGSRKDNSIHPEVLQKTIDILRSKGINLCVITPSPSHKLDIQDNLPYRELFRLVHYAKRLFVTDSGLLWVAHFTNTPVSCMLRHTNEKQRLTYAPHESRHINLNLSKTVPKDSGYVFSGDSEELATFLMQEL